MVWLSVFLGLLLLTSLTEWIGELSSFNRTFVVVVFILVTLISASIYIIKPILLIIKINRAITDEVAAKSIGKYFPLIGDKLLNYLELSHSSKSGNSLIEASLNQRAKSFEGIEFSQAVDISETKKPIRIFIPIALIIIVLLIISPSAFLSSTNRIIHFRQEFIPAAPFLFQIDTKLKAYQNEDYLLTVRLVGNSIPNNLYFVEGNSKLKMAELSAGLFTILFPKLQQSKSFHLESAGYMSSNYNIELISRPSMNFLSAKLTYPKYLQKKEELIEPAGELQVPEGTVINWQLNTQYTEEATFFYNTDTISTNRVQQNLFSINQKVSNTGIYGFLLHSNTATQKGKIEYAIRVIKDEMPSIQVKSFFDTLLYRSVIIGGEINDDYGITQLQLVYKKENTKNSYINLPFEKGSKQQQVYTTWLLDSLHLSPGEQVSYYIQVTDNDYVNGFKSSKSQIMYLKIPTKEELENKLEKAESVEKSSIVQSHKKAKEIKDKLEKTLEGIRGKKELSWEDKQNIKDLLKEKEKLNSKIEELKEENKLLQLQRDEIQKPSPELEEKAQQIQNLMNELLDEETKRLYEELQKMLEEQSDADKVQSLLNNIQNKEINLQEELERTLELFKRLQVEQNLEKLTEDLNQLASEQDSLAHNTSNKENSTEEIKKNQEEIEDKFDAIKDKLEETKDKNNELKNPESFDDTSGEEEDIKNEINEAKENLDKDNRNKSSQNQKNSSKKMRELSEKLDKMQGAMQMEQMQEDINNLRGVLENLITLSYNQEQIMKDFRAVNQSNPQFVTLSEQQLKIQDDSKIIKDSLLSLANRVMSISSFVTRELNEMDAQLEKSTSAIKDRKKAEATGYQQLSMTSMNNLALMLDNVLQQMQESMADAMGKGKGEKKKPMPGMSELQEQLNKEIRELQQSGKKGKELSEELAKLAAKQEMIRKALRDAEQKLGDKESDKPGNLGNLQKQMEQTELDLVNKNLSKTLQQRQQQIMTRLLEAEKALREQEIDSKRESKSATQYEKELPRAFEDYLKQKQKEIELIKTIPPKLHPYYKKEVNDYFKRLKSGTN